MARPIELTPLAPLSDSSRFLTEDPPIPTAAFALGRTVSYDDDAATLIQPPWKRSLHALLEQPQSSNAAIVLHMVVTTLILTSALVTVLETVPSLRGVQSGAWFGVETTLVVLFTIEYVARCVAWSWEWRALNERSSSPTHPNNNDSANDGPHEPEARAESDGAEFADHGAARGGGEAGGGRVGVVGGY
ncbi:hypothetical protein C0991_005557 [Blastosporella zonata]|nr:hypothetical protein C0991_005557 [Blastosporella zonata]